MRYFSQDVCSYYIGEEKHKAEVSIIKPPPLYLCILVSIIGLQVFKLITGMLLDKSFCRFGSIRFNPKRINFKFECQSHVCKEENAS